MQDDVEDFESYLKRHEIKPSGLLVKLDARCDDDTATLTRYAIEHGVELPDGYTPEWYIAMLSDLDGSVRGFYWVNPFDGPQAE